MFKGGKSGRQAIQKEPEEGKRVFNGRRWPSWQKRSCFLAGLRCPGGLPTDVERHGVRPIIGVSN